jgi:hypothetical protein
MGQCVITAFKLYYLKRTFTKCITAIDAEEGSGQQVIQNFWKGFNILDDNKTVRDAWNDVKVTTLKFPWKKLCPQLLDDFEGFENPVPEVTKNIVEIARQLELEVEPEDVAELVEPHSQPLSNDDLLALEANREDEDVSEEVSIPEPEGLTTKIISEAIRHFEMGMALLEKHDRDFDRNSKVNSGIVKEYACYTEIYTEKRQSSMQTSLDVYLKRKRPAPTETPARPSTSTETPARPSTSTGSPARPSTSTQSRTPSIDVSKSSSKSPARKRLALHDSTTYEEYMHR